MSDTSLRVAVALIPGFPLMALALVAAMVLARRIDERLIARATVGATLAAWLTTDLVAWTWLRRGGATLPLELGRWFSVDGEGFTLSALLDVLSLTMAGTTALIALLVAHFSERYLHREAGFARFYLLLNTFTAGMLTLVLAGSFDLLFVGWEAVGLASMLLVGFFRERPGPLHGALRVMVTYRAADVGLLVAAVLLHQSVGSSEFAHAFGGAPWPGASTHLTAGTATGVALWLLAAVIGKSAQFPLGGWLPEAMEGPTSSSALFYGALSVHAGVYLLLRAAPLLEASPVASIAVGLVGALTAAHATLVGRTQTNAKDTLAYATMTQVGLMLVGVSLHLWTWVLVHMIAHACLRLFQFLRTPSALRDAHELHAALDEAPRAHTGRAPKSLPPWLFERLYFAALHRFFVDTALTQAVVRPTLELSRGVDLVERSLAQALPTRGWIPRVMARAPVPLLPLGLGGFFTLLVLATRPSASEDLWVLLVASLFSALYAAVAALAQQDLRRAIAHVFASQLSMVPVGVAVADPHSALGAMLLALALGAAATGMLLLTDAIEARVGRVELARVGGLVARFPRAGALFLALALASAGFPLSLHFVAEDLMLRALLHHHPVVASAFLLATVLNGITLLRLFFRAFYGPLRGDPGGPIPDLRPRELAPLALLVALSFVGGAAPQRLLDRAGASVHAVRVALLARR